MERPVGGTLPAELHLRAADFQARSQRITVPLDHVSDWPVRRGGIDRHNVVPGGHTRCESEMQFVLGVPVAVVGLGGLQIGVVPSFSGNPLPIGAGLLRGRSLAAILHLSLYGHLAFDATHRDPLAFRILATDCSSDLTLHASPPLARLPLFGVG